ncbi:ABC transporter permease [bacterium]|nr:ABC transporter permease [candidate division CSSED10-310 bacterium]
MGVIGHLIRKEFLQVLKDRPMMAIIFIMPLVQLFILGYAITTDVKNIPLGFLDHDRSADSRALIQWFEQSGRFSPILHCENPQAVQMAFDKAEISLAVVIAKDFSRNLLRSEPSRIQIIADGVDSNTSLIAAGYARKILTRHFALKYPEFSPGEVRFRAFYNPELESAFTIVPGIISLLLMIVTSLLTAMGLVREREIGTLEQLNVTPIRPVELILGKILPFVILGGIVFTLGLTVALVWFKIPMEGALGTLVLFVAIFLLVTLGLGVFISTVTSTQQQAVFLSWFVLVVSVLMSGFMFPISNMPAAMQKVTYAIPLRYFITALREILLKGATAADLTLEWQALSGLGAVIFLLAVLKFRKRI